MIIPILCGGGLAVVNPDQRAVCIWYYIGTHSYWRRVCRMERFLHNLKRIPSEKKRENANLSLYQQLANVYE